MKSIGVPDDEIAKIKFTHIMERGTKMKRFMPLFIGALFVMGLALTAYADEVLRGRVVSIDSAGKTVVIDTPAGSRTVVLQETTKGVEGVKPGMSVEMTCFDVEGKFCASRVTVVPAGPVSGLEVVGNVVSIDPAGRAVVIRTEAGEKTLYYQKSTTGAGLDEVQVGKNVRAYCLDVDGKSCIRDIKAAE